MESKVAEEHGNRDKNFPLVILIKEINLEINQNIVNVLMKCLAQLRVFL